MLPLDVVIVGTPISLQGSSRSRDAWKGLVQRAAYEQVPDGAPLDVWTHEHLQVWIVYAHVGEMEGDLDNLAKPILDALNGPLWTDDRQIAHLTLRRVRRDGETWSARGDLPESVAEVLRRTEENEEFVFVRAVPYVADPRLP